MVEENNSVTLKIDQFLRMEHDWEKNRMELAHKRCRLSNVCDWNPRTKDISYNASLLVMNSLSFCSSEKKVFISPFLKDIFAEYRILVYL